MPTFEDRKASLTSCFSMHCSFSSLFSSPSRASPFPPFLPVFITSSPFIFFTLQSQFLLFLLGLALQSYLEFFSVVPWQNPRGSHATLLGACASKLGHKGVCAQYLWRLSCWNRSQMASAVVIRNVHKDLPGLAIHQIQRGFAKHVDTESAG